MATNSYTKQTWEDAPSTNSPISADRLNHMETGIKDNNTGVIALEAAVGEINNSLSSISTTLSTKANTSDLNNKAAKTWTTIKSDTTTISGGASYTVSDITKFNEIMFVVSGTIQGGPTHASSIIVPSSIARNKVCIAQVQRGNTFFNQCMFTFSSNTNVNVLPSYFQGFLTGTWAILGR